MSAETEIPPSFDFADHSQKATAEYLTKQAFYADLAAAVGRILEQCLQARKIKVQTVQHRAKSPKSFSEKAIIPSEHNPSKPRYSEPLKEITDLAGVRIITYFRSTLDEIDLLLNEEFDVIERSDKSELLVENEKFGYQSVHYLVRMKMERARFAEYQRYSGIVAEIQVRTVLQHAWAEIEHDIQYKSSKTIPVEIRRRFMALAGMLEIADREFQAIANADRELETYTEAMVGKGDVAGLEITPKSLKLFLDRKLSPDGRISDWSYDWETRLLHQLGFRDLQQVDTAIEGYNDGLLSQIVYGIRQGQTSRFELMLLAAMGKPFIERHILSSHEWFQTQQHGYLHKLRQENIEIKSYDPDDDTVRRGDMVASWPQKIRDAQHEPNISIGSSRVPG
jgi:putative GTP pyrophosphokinase